MKMSDRQYKRELDAFDVVIRRQEYLLHVAEARAEEQRLLLSEVRQAKTNLITNRTEKGPE